MTAILPSSARILFVGNSYTSRNNLPRLIAGLAASTEPPTSLHVEAIVAGGASLKRHWNAGLVQKALQTAAWDYVVLQEQSTLPLKNPTRYHENVRLFDPDIKKHGAKTALYLTWARQQAPESQHGIDDAVEAIAGQVGALVVPVGPAWQEAMTEAPAVRLYVEDGSHPSAAGSYLSACVFHVRFFDRPPSGSTVSESLKIERATAAMLENVAWRFRVRH